MACLACCQSAVAAAGSACAVGAAAGSSAGQADLLASAVAERRVLEEPGSGSRGRVVGRSPSHRILAAVRIPSRRSLVLRLEPPGSHEDHLDPESEVVAGIGLEEVLAGSRRTAVGSDREVEGRGIVAAVVVEAEVEFAVAGVEGLVVLTADTLACCPDQC